MIGQYSSAPRFKTIRDSLREAAHVRLGQQDILFKGVLGRYRLCWPIGDDFAVVDSPS